MGKRYFFTILLITGVVITFAATALYATDVIKMKNKAYKKHKYAVVTFQHKLHAKDYAQKYPALYKDGCGVCHHDENNKPLSSLKSGDKVQSCIECHAEPATKPSKVKMSKKEKIKKYHAEAIHENCRGCHKDFNKKKGFKSKDKGAAPTSCKKCHVK